jgi:uncharacterized protein (UPF0333 family)
MRNKRGQAAMEFLMTYGWAILAAIIVVGVLWYIIGNPGNLAGDRFTIGAPFVQKGMNLDSANVVINVLNGAGESVTVTEIDFSASGVGTWTGTSNIPVGAEANFSVTHGQTSGDRLNTDFTVTYTEGSSTFEQTVSGSITAKVP